MRFKLVRLTIGTAIMLALALSAVDIVRENQGLFRRAAESAEGTTAVTEVFGNQRYENVVMFYADASIRPALFEPLYGTYVGAYIQSDGVVRGDFTRFEQMMGRHNIFMYRLEVTGDFSSESLPHEFIFESVVRGRAPFFVLEVSDGDILEAAEILARELGHYLSPMFVQPPEPRLGENPQSYIARFALLRDIFRRHAPNVAFVYGVDIARGDITEQFYPGDEYVDWVAIRAMASMSPDRPFRGDTLAAIEQLYFAFQSRAPVFVCIGVSRQSGHNFIQHSRLAAGELERIYTALLTEFPRVRGIIYMNINEVPLGRGLGVADNYLITDDNVLREAYRELVTHPGVMPSIAAIRDDEEGYVQLRSRYGALRIAGLYYVGEQTLTNELRVPRNQLRGRSRSIDGERFYPLEPFIRSGRWVKRSYGTHIVLESGGM